MLTNLNKDGLSLFCTRFIRAFSFGFLSVGLVLYLDALGFSQFDIGLLFTFTMIGDLIITFYLTTTADSFGRKNILIIGAALKLFAGLVYAFCDNFWVLAVAGTIGVISPTGGEIGPFLAVEQAALAEAFKNNDDIPKMVGWYNVIGYTAQALGAVASGGLISILISVGYADVSAYRFSLIGYSIFALLKGLFYMSLSHEIEPLHARDSNAPRNWFSRFGLHHPESKAIVFKLSGLFIIDSFAGGFVMQTLIVFWFHTRWGMTTVLLGTMMMGANILAGFSALLAAPLVKQIGAINTMVFTHLPSNVLLLMIPFMPTLWSAVFVLLLRFSISQMDVPARQSYVVVSVASDERSAANGITNIVRSLGVSLAPLCTGVLLDDSQSILFNFPFIVAGTLKIFYDLLLYYSFRSTSQSHAYATVSSEAKIYPPEEDIEGGLEPHLSPGPSKSDSSTSIN